MARPKLRGHCPECGLQYDLGTPPEGTNLTALPCQAVIGHVNGEDVPFLAVGAPP